MSRFQHLFPTFYQTESKHVAETQVRWQPEEARYRSAQGSRPASDAKPAGREEQRRAFGQAVPQAGQGQPAHPHPNRQGCEGVVQTRSAQPADQRERTQDGHFRRASTRCRPGRRSPQGQGYHGLCRDPSQARRGCGRQAEAWSASQESRLVLGG